MPQLHQELKDYHDQIENLLKHGWGLWSAMKRVLLVVLEQRDRYKAERDALSIRLARAEGLEEIH